jgi:predicted RNase H-like nuclease
MKFAGVDGCKGGWVAVITDGRVSWDISVLESIESLWARNKNASLILIDIPIGLAFRERRRCDVEARKLLGAPRSSSLFPVPSRSAAEAVDLEAAKEANTRDLGVSLSLQTWGICPKISEVDRFLGINPRAEKIIRESHPEICFWALAGGRSMAHSKKTKEGVAERLNILKGINGKCQQLYEEALSKYQRMDVAKDDIIDALVLALTAGIQGELRRIPSEIEKDKTGLIMEIVYKRKKPLHNRLIS